MVPAKRGGISEASKVHVRKPPEVCTAPPANPRDNVGVGPVPGSQLMKMRIPAAEDVKPREEFREGARDGSGQGELVVWVRHGLGNRLCALIAAIVVSRRFGAQLKIVWEYDGLLCAARLGDLFVAAGWDDFTLLDKADTAAPWIQVCTVTDAAMADALRRGETLHVVAYDFFGRELFQGFTFYEEVRDRLHRFELVPAVRRIVESVNQPLVGLHARMTDHLPSRLITPRWCYRHAMDTAAELLGGEKIYVCSDTPAFVEELDRNHEEIAVSLPRVDGPFRETNSSMESVQLALAELWILSSCRLILASPCSSFAKIASVLGGGEFCHLIGWTRHSLQHQKQFAWELHKRAAYLGRDRWGARERDGKHPFVNRLAAALANLICAPFHQDRSLALQRKRLTRRITSAFRRLEHGAPLPATREARSSSGTGTR